MHMSNLEMHMSNLELSRKAVRPMDTIIQNMSNYSSFKEGEKPIRIHKRLGEVIRFSYLLTSVNEENAEQHYVT